MKLPVKTAHKTFSEPEARPDLAEQQSEPKSITFIKKHNREEQQIVTFETLEPQSLNRACWKNNCCSCEKWMPGGVYVCLGSPVIITHRDCGPLSLDWTGRTRLNREALASRRGFCCRCVRKQRKKSGYIMWNKNSRAFREISNSPSRNLKRVMQFEQVWFRYFLIKSSFPLISRFLES